MVVRTSIFRRDVDPSSDAQWPRTLRRPCPTCAKKSIEDDATKSRRYCLVDHRTWIYDEISPDEWRSVCELAVARLCRPLDLSSLVN